ncbi:probable ATP-dependent RNA helicase DDX4 [Acropora millepora]|uniref:probable ATP-dependent RNA helicase DDX4 n=1 Tax=Acropora millepora TaxID=45264 RepID=UPI001CF14B64|nr:probable ATP-dependent RNA helicase DDX4 [Acropora millepora]
MADDWEEGSGSTSVSSFGSGGGFGRGKFGANSSPGDEAPRRKGFGRGGFGSASSSDQTTDFDSGSRQNGFGGSKGFGRGGGGGSSDSEKPPRGFGSGGGGGFPKSGGFKSGGGFGKKDDNNDEESNPSSGGGGFGSRRSGFGGGGGFSGGDDGEDGGGRGGGFGRGSGSGGHKEEGHFARDRPQEAEQDPNRPPRVTYVPPTPDESEEAMFRSIERGINFDKYDEIPVEVTGRGKESIIPIQSFSQAQLYDTFQQNVKKSNYTKPTPVQKYAIPAILGGRDVMACAQTGSGKTAAFLLPVMTGMLQKGLTSSSMMGGPQCPQALIISPTRELTCQIYNEARKFSYETIVKTVVVYGGVSVPHQLRKIEMGCNLLVATPGRLKDFIERGKISLEKIQYLILDEADRMLDMGFEPVIRQVVEKLGMPGKCERQTLMFSATFPEEIQRLAGDFLNDYIFITVGRVGGTTSDIQQTVMDVSDEQKREKLMDLLSCSGSDRTLVFVESKRGADFLASLLSQEGFPTTSIHGDRLQQQREEALEDFRRGRCPVLIATNVAARGLDIDNVKHVVNYDLPSEIDEFVHRVGRTGRIGHQGKATSFFTRGKDDKIARSLVKVLSDASQEVPEWLDEIAESAVGTSYGPAGGRFASRDTRRQYGGGRGGASAGGGDSGWGTEWNSDSVNSEINGTSAWSPGGGEEEEW